MRSINIHHSDSLLVCTRSITPDARITNHVTRKQVWKQWHAAVATSPSTSPVAGLCSVAPFRKCPNQGTSEEPASQEDQPTLVHPWPYLEEFFEMVGSKNNSFRMCCKLCAPKYHELMAFKNSPSNLKKHIEVSLLLSVDYL